MAQRVSVMGADWRQQEECEMNQWESEMESNTKIYAAFVKAQKGFAPALKTSTNPHFKSRYADLAACVEAVLDSLNANGIGLVQKTHQDESGVTVETCFIHESGESMSGGTLHVPAAKNDPQGYGSALSYARRYSLMAACGIAPEDDDGNAASKPRSTPMAAPTPAKSVSRDTFDKLPPSDQDELRNIAMEVVALMVKGDVAGAVAFIDEQALDADSKVGLWSLLDSAQRAAIKKHQESLKQPLQQAA
jgi:hypothetical protein